MAWQVEHTNITSRDYVQLLRLALCFPLPYFIQQGWRPIITAEGGACARNVFAYTVRMLAPSCVYVCVYVVVVPMLYIICVHRLLVISTTGQMY